MDKPMEYAFTLSDGTIRYEQVYERKEIFAFQKLHGAVSAAPVARLTNRKRRDMLGVFTVEHTANGWLFCRQRYEKDREEWSKPYRSIASLTLMVARQLRKEIERRDALCKDWESAQRGHRSKYRPNLGVPRSLFSPKHTTRCL